MGTEQRQDCRQGFLEWADLVSLSWYSKADMAGSFRASFQAFRDRTETPHLGRWDAYTQAGLQPDPRDPSRGSSRGLPSLLNLKSNL